MKIFPNFEEFAVREVISSFDDEVILNAMTAAAPLASELGYQLYENPEDILPEAITQVSPSGASFTIPLVLPVDLPSGDNRSFMQDSLSSRWLPLPLMWQILTADGHSGSAIVGRIDSIEVAPDGLRNAKGVFDVGPYGREAERLVRGQFLRGISADLDNFEASSEDEPDEDASQLSKKKDNEKPGKKKNDIKNRKITVENARLMGVTLVAKPAFQECIIMIDPEPTLSNGDEFLADGIYEDLLDTMDNELAALAASAAPIIPPRDWFVDPKLSGPTPLTIDDDGKVFGHIASWHVDHIGLSKATKPPRSASKYAYFRTGLVRTDDGSDVAVGQLTLAGGHASMSASASEAVKHYDDTASAVADVTAGEDQFGIWVAGALRPDITPSQVRALRASAPSGDWRPIRGRLELVAVCQVNVPGFPNVRTMVAGGQLTALVAAGTAPLLALKEENSMSLLEKRISALETQSPAELSLRKAEMMDRMASFNLASEKKQEEPDLAALAASARERMSNITINIHPSPSIKESELAARAEEIRKRYESFNI